MKIETRFSQSKEPGFYLFRIRRMKFSNSVRTMLNKIDVAIGKKQEMFSV